MIDSVLDYKLDIQQQAALGRIIVTFSHIGYFINEIQNQVGSKTPHDVEWPRRNGRFPIISQQLRFIKTKLKNGHLPEIADLFRELRWAMSKIVYPRNMLAHAILLHGTTQAESLLWSQEHRRGYPILDLIAIEDRFNYALWVSLFIQWKLLGIQPHKPLPKRPS